jgi:hypothetical protein
MQVEQHGMALLFHQLVAVSFGGDCPRDPACAFQEVEQGGKAIVTGGSAVRHGDSLNLQQLEQAALALAGSCRR